MSRHPVPSPVPVAAGEPAGGAPAATGRVAPSARAREALAKALDYAREAPAPNTRYAYSADWRHFEAWCGEVGLPSLPAAPGTVAGYIAEMAPHYALATLRRRLVAIQKAHRLAGHADFSSGHPLIRTALKGIARKHGRPQRRAAALTTPEIRRLVAACGSDLAGLRDRALILLGYAGALRRAELVAVDVEHIRFTAEGLTLHIPRSKGDQAGEGANLGIPRGQRRDTCPVRALEAWMEASDTKYGPLFRKVSRWGRAENSRLHPDGVRQILRRRAEEAGVEGTALEPVTPHSLRSGMVTQAFRAGLSDEVIMAHSRHRDLRTMRRYVRRSRLLEDSPAKRLEL